MVGVDEAGNFCGAEVVSRPEQRGLGCFGGIASTVFRCHQHPTQLGNVSQRRLQVALEISKTHFAYKVSRFFFFDDPVSETQKGPMAAIA